MSVQWHRGHPITPKESKFVYADGVPCESEERPCPACKLTADSYDSPDPCLGIIEGVSNACCGHGLVRNSSGDPYVQFGWGTEPIRYENALSWFKEHNVGPTILTTSSEENHECR